MADKKVVKFRHFIGWNDHPTGAMMAVLGGVSGHHRLGDQKTVYTSMVVGIDYDEEGHPTRIETLNTIYEKE